MKQLFKLLPVLLIFSCIENDVDLQKYHKLRENNFMILGKMVDLEEVVTEAKKVQKPILFYFNSLACVNCRTMEEHVLGNRRIVKTIVENFLLVPVIVDDKTAIPIDKRRCSKITGKMMRTVGTVNVDLAIEICQRDSQPVFTAMNTEKEVVGQIPYTRNKRDFLQFLESAVEKYEQAAN